MLKPTLGAEINLDRCSDKRSDEKFIASLRESESARFLVLTDFKPVIDSCAEQKQASIRWFSHEQLSGYNLKVADAFFLGVDREDGSGVFALAISDHRATMIPNAVQIMRPAVDLRSLAMQGEMPSSQMAIVGMAKALAHWHDNARCCGHCGASTEVKDGGWKRKCWACGREHFPRTDPVVIMLVVDPPNERCLLGHEARFVENMWSTLAGFLEHGEDIENAVRRETMEEAGIKIGEVRFHSTQPWPFPHSLMIGCHAIAETTEITIDPNEIVDARWFSRDELRLMLAGEHPEGLWVPGKQAIARSLIQSFVDGDVV